MMVKEWFSFLRDEIHSVVFATVDEDGKPFSCVIDIMLCDGESLFFLTGREKKFYQNLKRSGYAALSGIKGENTLSSVAVSLQGEVRETGTALLEEIFAQNPYLHEIFPTAESRENLTVFQLYCGECEVYDLRRLPPIREVFAFGESGRK